MTLEASPTQPLYDLLRDERAKCVAGITAALAGAGEPLVEAYRDGYERRAADWRRNRDRIDAQIAALPKDPVYAGGRRADLKRLTNGYRAGQVTRREFGARLRRLMGGGRC
jgi:hypothetical protein